MDLQSLFQFLRPETLKTMLRDVSECKDDPQWTVIRDAIMEYAASSFLDSDERNRFLRYDPETRVTYG